MKGKFAQFLSKPRLFKRIFVGALFVITHKPISLLFSSNLGRGLLYSSMPKNELVLNTTDEGLFFVTNTSDDVIGRSVFVQKKAFDSQHLIESFKILGVDTKSVLLDVGANIGTIGIYAVSQGYARKCIAFEPEPNNFDLLSKNVWLNALNDQFELHNLALSHSNSDSIAFELSPDNYGDHRVRITEDIGLIGESKRKVIEVPTATLDSIVKTQDLDDCVLFMDTQGFEGHILAGAKSLIARGVPIITEFWPYGLNRADGFDQFLEALCKGPYAKIFDLRDPSSPLEFSDVSLKKIADDLGYEDGFADLLITP
jgi:FkbM family methyltransferase